METVKHSLLEKASSYPCSIKYRRKK